MLFFGKKPFNKFVCNSFGGPNPATQSHQSSNGKINENTIVFLLSLHFSSLYFLLQYFGVFDFLGDLSLHLSGFASASPFFSFPPQVKTAALCISKGAGRRLLPFCSGNVALSVLMMEASSLAASIYLGDPENAGCFSVWRCACCRRLVALKCLFGCKPLLLSMGKSTVYCGVAGNGSVLNHGKATDLNFVASAAKDVGLKCPVTFQTQTM
nr:uncharacterized protein LOC107433423 isoform X2 [Ziziphus jujuba var. spinosa]